MDSFNLDWESQGALLRPEAVRQLFRDIKRTKEEKELKAKYELLRSKKAELKFYQNKENCKENFSVSGKKTVPATLVSQEDLKKTALKVLKTRVDRQKNHNTDKVTKNFKKATKQNGEVNVGQKKCAMSEYTPETDTSPRSVTVRGHNLTPEFLHRTFEKIGPIWKVRIGHNDQSGIVTFKTSESAVSATNTMDGCMVDGRQLSVSLTKKRNASWVEMSTFEGKDKKLEYSYKEKRTVHVAYNGFLTVQDFRNVFMPYGRVEKIYLSSMDARASSKKHFALVTFEYEEEAVNAVQEVNGQSFKGIQLLVSPQKPVFNDATINSWPLPQKEDSRELVAYEDYGEQEIV